MNVSNIISQLFILPFRDRHELAEYTVALLIPLLGAVLSFLSSDSSQQSVRWRKSLRKSRLSPPPFIFAIIWVSLYISMGHSSFIVYYRTHSPPQNYNTNSYYSTSTTKKMILSSSIMLYLVQCVLNHFYIIVLFGLQRIDLALLIIVPLWFSTALTTVLFFDVSNTAGNLMALVLAWVSVNVYFNWFLFTYNDIYTENDLPPLPGEQLADASDTEEKKRYLGHGYGGWFKRLHRTNHSRRRRQQPQQPQQPHSQDGRQKTKLS